MTKITLIAHQGGVALFNKDKSDHGILAVVQSITSQLNADWCVVTDHVTAVHPDDLKPKGKKKKDAPVKIAQSFCPIGVSAQQPRVSFKADEHSRQCPAAGGVLLLKYLDADEMVVYGYEDLSAGDQFNLKATAQKNALWQKISFVQTQEDSDK